VNPGVDELEDYPLWAFAGGGWMPELGGRRAEDGCEDSFDGVSDNDDSNDEESFAHVGSVEDAIVLDENADFNER